MAGDLASGGGKQGAGEGRQGCKERGCGSGGGSDWDGVGLGASRAWCWKSDGEIGAEDKLRNGRADALQLPSTV